MSHSSSPYDDDHHTAYSLFTRRVRDAHIPKGLKNPPRMDTYDVSTYPHEHIENIEIILNYKEVQGAVKCKLFVTNLIRVQ